MEEGGILGEKIEVICIHAKYFLEEFAVNKTSANLVQVYLFGQWLLGFDYLCTNLNNIIRNCNYRSNVYYNNDVNYLLTF